MTPCYGNGASGDPEAPNFPEHAGRENLDPTESFTYEFMKDFFTELVDDVVKDSFVHLGMDEVRNTLHFNLFRLPSFDIFVSKNKGCIMYYHVWHFQVYQGCWDPSHNPVIEKFMKEQGFTSLHQVQEYYTMHHVSMVQSLNVTPICWQDPLDYNVKVSSI